MVVKSNLCYGIGFFCLPLLFASCVNHLADEGEQVEKGESIPLKFVGTIHESVQTRMTNNQFEERDEVGLFALAGNTTLQEERYADNLHFVRSSSGEFTSDVSVYYPDDGVTLSLIGYYPYQAQGIAMGESTLPVSVSDNQSVAANYAASDFLVATKEGLSASKEAVPLTFNHQFFRLKIALVAGENENIQELLSANPELSVSGFYTHGVFDLQEKKLVSLSDEKEMVPAGEWKVEGNRLVGKELILLPQETTSGYQYILLRVGGKSYTTFFPSSFLMASGKQRGLDITFVASEDILMSKVNGEIGEWQGAEVDEVASVTLHNYVDITKLAFDKSKVYKVLHDGKQVAEICKEYLVAPEVAAQAIVVYPMTKDGQVDLTQGKVAQLLGKEEPVHGGSVFWNKQDNTLTYVPGHLPVRKLVYVMADGKISFSVTSSDEVLAVMPLENVVRDVRGGVIRHYPLVKVATQYWMGSNWEATSYADGKMLAKLDSVSADNVGYFQTDGEHHFYTARVAEARNFLPADWRIPNWNDWNLLKTYVNDEAAVLKSGEWSIIKSDPVAPVTQLTGLNMAPVGMWVDPYQNLFAGKYVAYWTLDETNTQVDATVFCLISDKKNVEKANAGVENKAFAIRCIRK